MDYTLIVNDEYTYPLLSGNSFDRNGDYLLVIQSDSFDEIKQKFSNITDIKIKRGNTLISETKRYDKYSSISLGDDYFDPKTETYHSTFRVSLSIADIATQISNISRQLDTNINYDEATLDELKRYRINQSKNTLSEFLDTHPLLSTAHNNTAAYYSVTKEKQDLMTQQYLSYQIAKAVDPEHAVLTYNATGEVCEPWEEAEFLQLIMEVKAYVYPLVSYQQTAEKMIMECATKEEVSEIVIDYDSAFSPAEPETSEEV